MSNKRNSDKDSDKEGKPKAKVDDREVFPVVGIGASAGGLEAFSRLIENLPTDTGMAFVVVQHLAPNQKSILPSLLAKKTEMPVSAVEEGNLAIEPNHIYVIPPGKDMELQKMKLVLTERRGMHTIDHFLFSLSRDSAEKAIGVILSGTATDGTEGIRKIKDAGGIALVQLPESAAYPDMPRSAIATGQVDLVLTPEEIADELARVALHPFTRIEKEEALLPEGMDDFQKVLALVHRTTSMDFSDYRETTIRRRILRRMALHRIEDLHDYVKRVKEDKEEAQRLRDDMLIKVTSFFRDSESFDALAKEVFPKLTREKAKGEDIRIWVAGCSTGEEVYSIAMCLCEHLDRVEHALTVKILATDLDEKAIAKAREGVYTSAIRADVSPERIRRFFSSTDGDRYRINANIREMCIFAKHNLISDPPFSKLDLISCRNVLIYMKPELQQRLIPMFHYALRTPGFLFLGVSESIGKFKNLFAEVDAKNKIFSRRPVEAHMPPGFTTITTLAEREGMTKKGEKEAPEQPKVDALRRQIDHLITRNFAPASLVIKESGEIAEFRGDLTHYFSPPWKKATLDVFEVIKDDFVLPLRSVLITAKQNKERIRRKDIRYKHNDKKASVDIEVIPFQHEHLQYFLVVFEERMHPECRQEEGQRSQADKEEIERLTREVDQCKQFVRDIIDDKEQAEEEYNAAIEELQSGNEELQSTNEELETAKEELQSTNEELATVNEELGRKNNQLTVLTDDLTNLLVSVRMPIIMVGSDLQIRRTTDAAAKIMGVLPTDVGRPIRDINLSVPMQELEQMLKTAIDDLTVREKEVQFRDNRWYSMQVRPYRSSEDKIEGAVISAIDIDSLKRSIDAANQAKARIEHMMETIPAIVATLDIEGRVQLIGSYATMITQFAKQELIGKPLYKIARNASEQAALKKMIRQTLEGERVHGYRGTINAKDGHEITVRWHTSPLKNGTSDSEGIVAVAVDITEIEQKEEQLRQAAKMEAIGRLAGGVAHDFNNYLTVIVGFANLLSAQVPEKSEEYASVVSIKEAASAASDLTRQLLGFGQKIVIKPVVLNLNDTLEAIRIKLNRFVGENIHIQMKEASDLKNVKADPAQVEQIVMNLVMNAADAMPGGGDITIETANVHFTEKQPDPQRTVAPGEYAMLAVSDTGHGMDEETQQHIFEPFFSTKETVKGSGLGLATVHGIVRQARGYITVESAIDEGSTFRVYLPVVGEKKKIPQPQKKEVAEKATPPEELPAGGETVLVVEDEPAVRAFLTKALEMAGYAVLATDRPQEAFSILKEHDENVGLVISDVVMPEMNGLELVRKLRKMKPDIPALYVSGYTKDAIPDRTIADADFELLTKPFTLEELNEKVRKVLGRKGKK